MQTDQIANTFFYLSKRKIQTQEIKIFLICYEQVAYLDFS